MYNYVFSYKEVLVALIGFFLFRRWITGTRQKDSRIENKVSYLPLRTRVFSSSPAELLATQRNSSQSLSVMFFSVNTVSEIPLVKTILPLYHVTLTGDKPLAVQFRVTFCPILSRGGVVTQVILGRSAMAANQIKKLDHFLNIRITTFNIT